MQTLKIEIPKGFEVASFDTQSGEIKFKEKPKSVLERINTFDDVLRELGEDDEEYIIYRKLLTVLDPGCHTVKYQRVVMIIKAYNEKKRPDWNDGKPKHSLYFVMASPGFRFCGCDGWSAHSFVGSRLCFLDLARGKDAAAKFLPEFEGFMTIK